MKKHVPFILGILILVTGGCALVPPTPKPVTADQIADLLLKDVEGIYVTCEQQGIENHRLSPSEFLVFNESIRKAKALAEVECPSAASEGIVIDLVRKTKFSTKLTFDPDGYLYIAKSSLYRTERERERYSRNGKLVLKYLTGYYELVPEKALKGILPNSFMAGEAKS